MNSINRNEAAAGGVVPSLVTIQAAIAPEAPALVDADTAITYGDLERRATALGRILRAAGVKREAVVGIALPRSAAAAVAALGVMKAGGAYLPLDPSHPEERLRYEVADAGAEIVVVDAASGEATLPKSVRSIPLSRDGSLGTTLSFGVADPFELIEPGDLAYIIYTSGSTGQPKGVEITHGSLANLCQWHRTAFDVRRSDRAGHCSAVGFDAAVWEIWPYLCAGASIHIADDGVAKDAEALRDWLVAHEISLSFASAPLAELLMDLDWPSAARLRVLLTGADTLHKYPAVTLPFALVNNYGPTEAAVVATSAAVPTDGGLRLPSIGRPIRNARVDIVDANGARVSAGEPGEIWIGGAGVARGYRGRPELSAQKFIPDPFNAAGHGRVYRTGDLGCFLPDGQLAFLGRIDDQIKIRGFRVEPREIEAILDEHPLIRESAVISHEFSDGDRRLVAYVVLRSKTARTVADLQAFLATRLPAYMLPSSFVALTSLPITKNGKCDRAALRALGIDDALQDDTYVAPRTAIEEQLASIVGPLLKLEHVSVTDNFFALGGHSLLGTRVIARVRDVFGVSIGLRFLFESPTIAALALEVDRLSGLKRTRTVVRREAVVRPSQNDLRVAHLSDEQVDAMLEAVGE